MNTTDVTAFLKAHDLKIEVQSLPESTHTAVEAANVVGCELGQIAKSVIFKSNEQPVLFIVSGANRVDTDNVELRLSIKLGRADAEFVKEMTGYSIGGVPPFAHKQLIQTYIDQDLLQYETVWAAGGSPSSLFPIEPNELKRITNATEINVR